jgi:hypothetical protein
VCGGVLATPLVPFAAADSEFRANSFTPSNQKTPAVAADSIGRFLVVWESREQETTNNSGVYGQAFNASGVPVGSEFHVNTFTPFDQNAPAVASQGNGAFVVVWTSCCTQDGWLNSIRARRFDAFGRPLSEEIAVNTYTMNHQDQPALATDANGNFVVVWRSYLQDGSFAGVFAQRFSAAGNRLGSEFRVNAYTSSHQDNPAVAMDAQGNFMVVWQSLTQECFGNPNPALCLPSVSAGIYGRRFDAGGNPGDEFRVNVYTTGPQIQPAVAALSNGKFAAAWTTQGQDGSGSGVYGRLFTNTGAPLAGEFRVNTTTQNAQSEPAVAAARDGEFVIAWSGCCEYAGLGGGIMAQKFDSNGVRKGSEFVVNSYTTGSQTQPAAAAISASRFVVVWNSFGQDGSLDGVFGRRFEDVVFIDGFNP